jgi:hypothetical protein
MPRVRYCMVEAIDCPRLLVAGCFWETDVRGTRLANIGHPDVSPVVSAYRESGKARYTVDVAKF